MSQCARLAAALLGGAVDITHDVNPRAMTPRVKGFVQAKNWFQDLAPVTVAPK